ncbi:MAG: type II toxin-antitoxin system death-on-curing family toxin [Dehalococcoidia bacterium]|nr:type II toxin-antitoxin system death-on-curing family toxin [Dehalococcoidia bacterium]
MTHDFPNLEEVIAMQKSLIEEFGGAIGIRDQASLESALLRPQIGYYDSIVQEAAALMESLAVNHPFIDGNKRTAFFVTDAFLRMNGHHIVCDNDEAYTFFITLFENNSFRFDNLVPWLDDKVRPTTENCKLRIEDSK